jgi:RNA polymerase sigma-70 factor (ECF subfamily)
MVNEPASPPPPADATERFVGLLLANERRVYGFIVSLVPHFSDADDLWQQTSTVLWRKFAEFEPGSDFAAWAMKIARYEVLKYRHRHAGSPMQFSDALADQLADEAAAVGESANARAAALQDCLGKLTDRDRELIRLRYEQEHTTRDVARQAGRSVDAIYKALNRIHGSLLACIRLTLREEGRR